MLQETGGAAGAAVPESEEAKAAAAAADREKAAKEGQAGSKSAELEAAEFRADAITEAIKKARSRQEASPKVKLIQEAQEKSETEEMRRALGLDVPFDVRALLIRGVVQQRGMKVGENMWIDMHTLNKAEDILAERLVEIHNGPMQISAAYLSAKTVAILAVAITRINKDRFPVPSLDPAERGSEGYKTDWELKQALMRSLLEMSPGDIDSLMLVYTNLDKMDVLVDEAARKNSSRP